MKFKVATYFTYFFLILIIYFFISPFFNKLKAIEFQFSFKKTKLKEKINWKRKIKKNTNYSNPRKKAKSWYNQITTRISFFFFWLINQKVRARELFFFSFSFFIAYLPEKRLFSSLPCIWCLSEWIICKVWLFMLLKFEK